jgi:hypothetical protein
MALGHLRISPKEWAGWELKDFWMAYEGWREVNVSQPQAIGRMTNFFIARTMGGWKGEVKELYSIAGEKKKKISKAIIRPMTEEEKKLHEELQNGQ